jgi:hypothetical protein
MTTPLIHRTTEFVCDAEDVGRGKEAQHTAHTAPQVGLAAFHDMLVFAPKAMVLANHQRASDPSHGSMICD